MVPAVGLQSCNFYVNIKLQTAQEAISAAEDNSGCQCPLLISTSSSSCCHKRRFCSVPFIIGVMVLIFPFLLFFALLVNAATAIILAVA